MSNATNTTRSCDGMPVEYISDSRELARLCDAWAGESFLAVDTEFERTNTFYARMGLLQFADSERCYLVDPLSIEDWSPLQDLLRTPSCTLVMHSCSEDLSLLQSFFGCLPTSLFDTQLAAAFLGLGFSISYQAMVEQLLGIEVAKDETRSDWIKRPLTEKQIHYAAADVRYLLQIREILSEQIQAKGMEQWLLADCTQQLEIARKAEQAEQWQGYYANVSNSWKLNADALVVLQRLCVWREETARRRNKPRNWIVKDNDLLALCTALAVPVKNGTLSLQDINSVATEDRRFLGRNAEELFRLLSASIEGVEIDMTLLSKPLNASLRKKLKLAKQVANAKADELEMSPELLGRKKYLVELLRDYEASGKLRWSGEFAGWRRELLESELIAAVEES